MATNSGGFEKRDVDIKSVSIVGVILLVVTVISMLLMGWMFGWLAGRESVQPPPLSSAGAGRNPEPPEPRLQTDQAGDIRRIRAAEDAILESYGWVDRNAGTVRVPIDRAIELVAERGLPPVPPPPPAGAEAPAAAPAKGEAR